MEHVSWELVASTIPSLLLTVPATSHTHSLGISYAMAPTVRSLPVSVES